MITAIQAADAAAIAERWIRCRALYARTPGLAYGLSLDGRTLLQGAMGYADVDAGTPVDAARTAFRVASITKTVTATLIQRQVERHRLRLDDEVCNLLPWARATLRGSGITVRDLLIHSAGVIRDGSNTWGDEDFPDRATLRREVRAHATFAEPLTFFRYSNVAYALLGEVLEAVTGRGFSTLVGAGIVHRLGLTDTATTLTARMRRQLATGYYPRRPEEPLRAARPTEARAISPAGGLISTVPDLLRYQEAHFPGDDRLLRELSKRDMQRVQWLRDEPPNTGLGWMIWNVDGQTVRGHSGGYPGFNTKIGFVPEQRLAAAVLTNTIGPTAGEGIDVLIHCVQRVNALWDRSGTTAHGHTRASLAALTGQYRGDWGEVLIVRVRNTLYLIDAGTPEPLRYAARLAPLSRTRFVIAEGDDYGHLGEDVSFSGMRSGAAQVFHYGPHAMRRADV